MRGLPCIFCIFPNEFNKFNIIGAEMLDIIYHTTLKLFCNRFFVEKRL